MLTASVCRKQCSADWLTEMSSVVRRRVSSDTAELQSPSCWLYNLWYTSNPGSNKPQLTLCPALTQILQGKLSSVQKTAQLTFEVSLIWVENMKTNSAAYVMNQSWKLDAFSLITAERAESRKTGKQVLHTKKQVSWWSALSLSHSVNHKCKVDSWNITAAEENTKHTAPDGQRVLEGWRLSCRSKCYIQTTAYNINTDFWSFCKQPNTFCTSAKPQKCIKCIFFLIEHLQRIWNWHCFHLCLLTSNLRLSCVVLCACMRFKGNRDPKIIHTNHPVKLFST